MKFLPRGSSFAIVHLASVLCLTTGCGDGDDSPVDASAGIDSGPAIDAAGGADARTPDASDPLDASTEEDASSVTDATVTDATTTDAEPAADAAGGDGCVAPRCPPIPVGCEVVAEGECVCPTVVCPPMPCVPACGRGLYCMYPTLCGGEGSCESIPDACTDVIAPVCGCNGVTYSNACEAASAGQSVMHDGECPAPEDCRTEGCRAEASCQACETPRGGVVYVCIPDGAAC